MKSHSILISLIVVVLYCSLAEAKYSGGTGEQNEPYKIATPKDLNDIGNYEEDWNKNFILVNDFNLAQYNGTQFNRVGTDWDSAFRGVYDGDDNKVWSFTWSSMKQRTTGQKININNLFSL